MWGTLLTAYGFLLGGAIDYLGALLNPRQDMHAVVTHCFQGSLSVVHAGVRRSLVLSFLLNCSSRLVMAATQSR